RAEAGLRGAGGGRPRRGGRLAPGRVLRQRVPPRHRHQPGRGAATHFAQRRGTPARLLRPHGEAVMRRRAVVLGITAIALLTPLPGPPQPPPPGGEFIAPGKQPRHTGEVSMVLLGDAGFGEGGASEWGGHDQAQIAGYIDALCPRPDLVFFLGDNIYWGGNPDLFGPRFDTMYRSLFDAEHRRVPAALGNHDVKGCQLPPQ